LAFTFLNFWAARPLVIQGSNWRQENYRTESSWMHVRVVQSEAASAPSHTVQILCKAPVVRFFPLVHYELGFLRIAILALAREQQKDTSAIQCQAQSYEKRPKENAVLH
jgi:hypothetical protein